MASLLLNSDEHCHTLSLSLLGSFLFALVLTGPDCLSGFAVPSAALQQVSCLMRRHAFGRQAGFVWSLALSVIYPGV